MTDDTAEFFEQVKWESSCKELTQVEKGILASQEVSHNYYKIFRYFTDGVSTTCHLCDQFMVLQTGMQQMKLATSEQRINGIIRHITDRHVTKEWLHKKYD